MHTDPIVIVSAVRTAMGNMLGIFKDISAPQLGAYAIQSALDRIQLDHPLIDEVLMGCVLPAGLGQAPARQAALHANLPQSVGATTINKMCGSGMKAIMLAHDFLAAGTANIVVSGGMENMTQAPYLIPKARSGYRFGHSQIIDSMAYDGLEDAYQKGKLMGYFAEMTAKEFNITREQQDQFAIESLKRAQMATEKKYFAQEIITINHIDYDEQPTKTNFEKIPQLKPAFIPDGTVTAANSSSISDGAAAVVLMKESQAKKLNLNPIAKIVAHTSHAHEPQWFTTAPVSAIKKLLQKTHWSLDQVDLFEINEAFAVVTLVAMQQLNLPHEKVNILGGACALGHPIGASGARILVTLLNALKIQNLKRGIAAICIGGGEATAIAVERY